MTPQFVSLPSGRLFTVFFGARGDAAMRVLFVPPFAEELNKCRRMMSVTARALAAAGMDVLLPDLLATGDSEGELHTTHWNSWLDNLAELDAWLGTRSTAPRSCWLTVRSGLLLAQETMHTHAAHPDALIAWQPVGNGANLLAQFLRLRVMSVRMAGGDTSVKALLASLDAGEEVAVAGYRLAASLTRGLGAARVDAKRLASVRAVRLMDFSLDAEALPGRASQALADALGAADCDVAARVVLAEPFWTTQEIAAPTAVSTATVGLCRELAA